MLSLVPAILMLLLQGPMGSDLASSGAVDKHPIRVQADAQRLLASLQRISCDPALSRMIAELFAEPSNPAVSLPPKSAEAAVVSAPLPTRTSPTRTAREGFARSVRLRAGPRSY